MLSIYRHQASYTPAAVLAPTLLARLLLRYADAYWRMLTYADVRWRMLAPALLARLLLRLRRRTHHVC